MSTPALTMAIIGTLHPASAAPPAGITFIGGTDAVGPTTTIALPAGCAAGDYVLLEAIDRSTTSTTLAGSTSVLAKTLFGNGRYMTVLGYVLTSTDIANGSIPVVSQSLGACAFAVFRGQNATPIDGSSTLVDGSGNSQVCNNASVTTTYANDMIVCMNVFNMSISTAGSATPPSGFAIADATTTGSQPRCISYATQASAGPTGVLTTSYANGSTYGYWGGITVALRSA